MNIVHIAPQIPGWVVEIPLEGESEPTWYANVVAWEQVNDQYEGVELLPIVTSGGDGPVSIREFIKNNCPGVDAEIGWTLRERRASSDVVGNTYYV